MVADQLNTAADLLRQAANDPAVMDGMAELVDAVSKAFISGNKLLVCGNGGSACDAMHVAEEFTGRFKETRKALPAISLTDSGHITCVANDFGYDAVFSRSVEALGVEGDVLIALSTSGRSQNVINAVTQANKQQMTTAALLGMGGGDVSDMANISIIVPGDSTDRIQEIHMTLLHCLVENVERSLKLSD